MKFSIVIPVYNAAPYLRECLRSVVAASDKLRMMSDKWAMEIVCVDDGSTDGSGKVLEEFFHQSTPTPHLYTYKILHQQNRGEGAARNRGLAEATGDWVGFLDADDVYAPEMISGAMELIAAHPDASLVALGLEELGCFGGTASQGVRVYTRADSLPLKLEMTSFAQMFIRREILAGLCFPSYAIGADRVLVARLARRAEKVVLSDRIGYRYRVHGASAQHAPRSLKKRWDAFRYTVHVLAILLATREAGIRIRLRYVKASLVRFLEIFRRPR